MAGVEISYLRCRQLENKGENMAISIRSLASDLQVFADAHDGLVRAEEVVEWARERPSSALYNALEWDDTEAAAAYRIAQVRQIIGRVTVLVQGPDTPLKHRVYVSYRDDRIQPGGGYRVMAEVLSDADRRAILLREALDDLMRWQRKYRDLAELADIFAAMDRVTVSA